MNIFQENVIYFLILWKMGFCARQRGPWFYPVTRKPQNSDQMFNIQRDTASQCRYVCMHQKDCLEVFYESARSQCTGYRSDTEKESIGTTVKGWKLVYIDWCPAGFQWQENVRKCYTPQVSQPVRGTDTVKVCKEMDPRATPAEPRDRAQMEIIKSLAAGITVWLGIHRPQNSKLKNDLKYYSDGTNITYWNWCTGDPNNWANKEHCVAAITNYGHRWADYPCSPLLPVICEI